MEFKDWLLKSKNNGGDRIIIKEDKGIIVNPIYYPAQKKWGLFIVDPNNEGTHEDYNVLFNSTCEEDADSCTWDTEQEAREYGHTMIKPF